LIPGAEGRSAGKQLLVGRPDSLASDRELTRRERKNRSRLVQLHEAFHVARIGPLQEEPAEILRLGRPLPLVVHGHSLSHRCSGPVPQQDNSTAPAQGYTAGPNPHETMLPVVMRIRASPESVAFSASADPWIMTER